MIEIAMLSFVIELLFSFLVSVLADNVIDVDDILEPDFMPGSLLVLENPETVQSYNTTLRAANISTHLNGSFNEAYHTMGFHRMKMNEYMCRNFIADEILTTMSLSRMRRRLGGPADMGLAVGNNHRADTGGLNQNLLDDEGSSNYKDWLTKSTTLEDIYKHYETLQHPEGNQNAEAQDRGDSEQKDSKDDFNEDYDDQITGYKVQKAINSVNSRPPAKVGYSGAGDFDAGLGGGYGGIGTIGATTGFSGGLGGLGGYGGSGHAQAGLGVGHGYGHQTYPVISHHQEHHYPEYTKAKGYEHHNSKDLSELFEIALTALAFLSFGMFIIEVVMCIHGTTAATTVTTMMPMMPESTGDGGGDTGTGTGREYWGDGRVKRDAPIPKIRETDNYVLNDLARRVLLSIEAVHIAHRDDGVCLKRELCKSNKFSRNLDDKQKIWVPVWSLGMSWLSGRVVQSLAPATSMLDSLKASILGLGKADCDKIYRKCELRKEKDERRRRRKRSTK